MLTDSSILYARGNDGMDGVALVWVIDGECLYDIPIWQEYSDMFLNSEEIIDISSESINNFNPNIVNFDNKQKLINIDLEYEYK